MMSYINSGISYVNPVLVSSIFTTPNMPHNELPPYTEKYASIDNIFKTKKVQDDPPKKWLKLFGNLMLIAGAVLILTGVYYLDQRSDKSDSDFLYKDFRPPKTYTGSEQIHAKVHVETYPVERNAVGFTSHERKMKFADAILHAVWTSPNDHTYMEGIDKLKRRVPFSVHVTEFEADCDCEYGTPADHLKTAFYEAFSRGPNELPAAQRITAWDTKGHRITIVWGAQVFECHRTACWTTDSSDSSSFLLTIGPNFEVNEYPGGDV